MSLFTKRSSLVEASLWNKNGDHPKDYVKDVVGLDNGEIRTFTGEECKARNYEGAYVRYFRHPDIPGSKVCSHCNCIMNDHGWIDKGPNGITVCPGDYVVNNHATYTVKAEVFKATFIAVEK